MAAANYLTAHEDHCALSIAVEVCSATLFFSEDPDILVSNAIFGDGAAAMVITGSRRDAGVRLLGMASGLYPEGRQHLQYRWEDSRLRNVLSARVPVLGARYARDVVEKLLVQHSLDTEDIAHWIIHPGGQKVLDAFERTVGLPPEALLPSRRILHDYGNMSSASVLFVLDTLLRGQSPAPGALGLMCSFGAGFSAYAGLIQF